MKQKQLALTSLIVFYGCMAGGDDSSDTITSPTEAPATMTGSHFSPLEGQVVFTITEASGASGATVSIGFNATDTGENPRLFGLRSGLFFDASYFSDFLTGTTLAGEVLDQDRIVIGSIGGEEWYGIASSFEFETDGDNSRVRIDFSERRSFDGESLGEGGWMELSGTISAVCRTATGMVDPSFQAPGFCASFGSEHPELQSTGLVVR